MIQSIERAMQIIDVLAADGQKDTWSVADLSEQTGLPASTIYRIIETLTAYHLVEQVPGKRAYMLGSKWLEYGMKLFDKLDVRNLARPALEQLARDVKETVYLDIPKGHESIIIDRVDSPRNVRIVDPIGERIPLHIGAANRTMLAHMHDSQMEQIFSDLSLDENETAAVKQAARETRRSGYAISFGEKTKGTVSVGAPVLGYGQKIHGAISAEFLEYDVTEAHINFIIEHVKQAAHRISEQLGRV
ncbi:IclR family transcriptional regulator [Lentibacillus kapialis]|uniref:IclR family transcriptional regulator n=1 Tax=Lentibacillus kapialis TaxID=340214 RepID=A0A917UY03_9BACI|nr:IclR family transcriptional regulator [Lentibacillus kapialis]GGJ94666.1 IclR family transcriptional regulator [Lentibacillus kapialis]